MKDTIIKVVIENYEEAIELAKTQKERKNAPKGKDYWDAYIDGANFLFQHLKYEFDFKPQVDEPTKEEKEKYKVDGEYPFGILRYRGQEAPVYVDDYGQQEYIYFNGECYGGGAYNFDCRIYFTSIIDYFLDKDKNNI